MAALIQISGLHKQYGPRVLFDDAEVVISEDQKFGVIGRNGAGKSTLFNIITSKEEADSGSVWLSSDLRLSYLEQKDTHLPDETVIDFLMRTTDQEEWRCGKYAGRFQIKGDMLGAKISGLAGGFRMRVKLTAMMLEEPNLLMLDEPTNYLDLKTLLMLEHFLRTFREAALIISHDREFLMKTCKHTLEVDNKTIASFPGNVEEYLEYKREVREQAIRENQNIEARRKELQNFVDRFRAKASKATQAQSKMKQISRLKTKEVAGAARSVRMRIPSPDRQGGVALKCKDLRIGYGDRMIADNISFELKRGDRFAILGDNGQGKSTFLKTIQGSLPALAGEVRWGYDTKIGYYAQHVYETLGGEETVLQYLERYAPKSMTRQEILNMAGAFLFGGDDTKKKVSILSGGERSRVLLLSLLLQKCDILLLDEPTNHLDFDTVEVLGEALQDFKGTVFFVSHDRTFVNGVATGILEVKNKAIRLYEGSYEDYVYYLNEELDRAEASDDSEPVEQVETVQAAPPPGGKAKADKKARDKELKALEKKHATLGRELETLQQEQKDLLALVEKNPDTVSKADYDRIGQLSSSVEEKEAEWLKVAESLERAKEPAG
jgi:ATP-binding cassette subfamily F protein 3